MRLREFFFDPEASDDKEYNPDECRFKEKSTWKPPKNRDPALEAYLKAVESDAWLLTGSVRRKDNLTPSEREALTKLRTRTDLIIKPADKGSATVVMSKKVYLAEAHRQLTNSRYYHKLDEDPTQQFSNQV